MKKRCLRFLPDGPLCRYIRWFSHFYKNPFISSRWAKRKELLDTSVVFGFSLLASSLWFILLVLVFISGHISMTDVVHPFYGVLLMLQSALVYGIIFGFSLHAISSVVSMRFFIQIILQALRLYAMMMPLLVTLFFTLLALMLNDFLQTSTPLWLFWLTSLLLLWTLWLQYAIFIAPVAKYLGAVFPRRKSIILALTAFAIAMVTLQFASVSYSEKVFNKKRFFSAAVNALYADGRVSTGRRDELKRKIAESSLFGR